MRGETQRTIIPPHLKSQQIKGSFKFCVAAKRLWRFQRSRNVSPREKVYTQKHCRALPRAKQQVNEK
jgi:hypothetical protein